MDAKTKTKTQLDAIVSEITETWRPNAQDAEFLDELHDPSVDARSLFDIERPERYVLTEKDWRKVLERMRAVFPMPAEEEEEEDEEEEEESAEEYFDRKYPRATCHRCEEPVTGATVVYCGGSGGACETWYCGDCHEDGTDDCCVCHH